MIALLFALLAAPAHAGKFTVAGHPVAVYTPAGYDAKKTYDLAIFFDGDTYPEELGVFDALPQPMIVVTVDNSANRLGDLANRAKFADLMANDVMPAVRSRYSVTRDPSHVTIGGYSAGGLGAMYVAFRHPEVFGNVMSQSGAYWRGNEGTSEPGEWLTEQFRKSPKLPLRIYLDVGGEELIPTVNGIPILIANRHLRDVLRAKGYTMEYVEVPGAHHEPGHWKSALPAGLAYLCR
ncbi:MAG TPA: alpha/beta hydrolase-fold protein [Thermoanaerobaculia bacterium]|nr:alpha/beta hydrolase-fold protein [Thermoanaerobaculia bacterium]